MNATKTPEARAATVAPTPRAVPETLIPAAPTAPPASAPPPLAAAAPGPLADPVFRGDYFVLIFWFACAAVLVLLLALDPIRYLLHR